MKKIGLRTKLMFTLVATLIIPMAVSIGLVAFIITQQNRTASYGHLKKSADIIRDDLQSRQKKLIADVVQVATINQMGEKIKLLFELKKDDKMATVTENAYKETAKDIYQIEKTSNLWKAAIYDADGELISFALHQDDGTFFVGYTSATDKAKLHSATLKSDGTSSQIEWKDTEITSNFEFALKFGREIPKENLSLFEPVPGFICTVGYAPVFGNHYNEKTNQLEKRQFGVAVTVQKIDKAFVEKMTSITGIKVNVFTKEALSVGTLPQYSKLGGVQIKEKNGAGNLAKQEVLLSDIDVGDESYFQGILPLLSPAGPVGAIAALYSKNVAKANTRQIIWVLTIVYGGCILVLVPLAMFFANALFKPIRKCVAMAKDIGEGDFSQRINVTSQDEVGALMEAFNKMSDSLSQKANLAAAIGSGNLSHDVPLSSNKDMLGQVLAEMTSWLNDILGQINESITRTALGASQVSDSSQALSQGATEQAASLEEITSSMIQLASQTKSNADNAFQANQLALAARKAAETGNDQMGEMTLAMKGINDSGKEIAKIIKAIDEIAFQTNLLALNAAVEAARAGKHGKGFAVVAQEVRNLAGRSAKAAQETAELIQGSVKKVENGNVILTRTAESLAGIVEAASKVADLVGEIATSSNEQAQGISQINQGLGQIEKVTLQNTSAAEETAAATAELSSQSLRLREIVSQFKLKTYSPTDLKQIPQ